MLLGIAFISFGVFAVQITNSWWAGIGAILPFIGLGLCIIGLINKKD